MAVGRSVPWLCALLLLLAAWVDLVLGVAPCDVTEYQPEDSNLCCRLCPAGQYVFKPCRVNHTAGECRVCEPGTFLAFPNGEPTCQRCIQCREGDQEVVAKCSPTSDRQCQCKKGSFYCNSVDCVENCLRCKRCPGVVLSPCNATSNTVCATETDRGRPENKRGSEFLVPWVTVSVILAVAVIVGIYWYKKKGRLVPVSPGEASSAGAQQWTLGAKRSLTGTFSLL
uniref:TNFR-Cys domain-containing protein n=1 Tax=Lynx canadensis TaxID=61383 RepID=A0A667IMC4_LYNCA